MPERRALIDIGTNSVKLLVAEIHPDSIQPLIEKSTQTRLGRGFYHAHQLQPEPIAATARAVAAFAREAAAYQPSRIRVIATSAVRDAQNQDDLLRAVESAAGLPIQVISGHQEADWVFDGVNSDPRFRGQPLLIVDLGGGSTEFILGQGQTRFFKQSSSLGSVRLLEQLRPADPPAPADWLRCHDQIHSFLRQNVHPQLTLALAAFRSHPVQLVGTGGATTILACIEQKLTQFDRTRIEAAALTLERLRHQRQHLWSLPLAERKTIVGLPPNRADVILTGIAIYETVMEQFAFPTLAVSTRGLRFAAL